MKEFLQMSFVVIVGALFIYIGLSHSFFFLLPGAIISLVAIVGLWVMISSLWEKDTDEELDKFLDEDFDKFLAEEKEKKSVSEFDKEFSSPGLPGHGAQKKHDEEKSVSRPKKKFVSPYLPARGALKKRGKKKSKRSVRPQESPGLSLVLLGWQLISVLLFLAAGCSAAVHYFLLPEDARAFLETEKFLVTPNGHIACASRRRVLIYDLDGRFVRSWALPKMDNFLYLETNSQNHLSVITIKKIYAYNLNGKLLREQKASDRSKTNPFAILKGHHCGKIYRFCKFFRPQVVQIDPHDSKRRVLIAASWYETFSYVICTFFLLLGGYSLFIWASYTPDEDEEARNKMRGHAWDQVQWKLWTFPIKSHPWLLVCGPVGAYTISAALIWSFALLTRPYFSNNFAIVFFTMFIFIVLSGSFPKLADRFLGFHCEHCHGQIKWNLVKFEDQRCISYKCKECSYRHLVSF